MKKIHIFLGRQIHFWLKPFIYFLTNNSNRTRVLINYQNQILLVKGYISDNTWGFPGGGVKKSEAIEKGLIREVLEETAIKLDKNMLTFVAKLDSRFLIFKQNIYLYKVTLKQKPNIHPQKHEISYIRWFKLNELEKYKFSKNNLKYLNIFYPDLKWNKI